jgi:predicted transcriptional regulator
MSDSSPKTPENPPANPIVTLPKLDPVAAMFALGSAFRWPIIQMLADGREMSITEGAKVAGCTAVNFSKHLGVMLKSGVVDCRQGTDRRQTIFYIPAARRQVPGVIDYGFCKLDVKPV